MAEVMTDNRRGKGWRIALWLGAGALLLVPAVAMQFTPEVQWDKTDFLVMGALIAAVGGAIEFLMRRANSPAYRAGAALTLVTSFLLIWVNLAAGVIGTEDHGANLLYAGVLAILAGGALRSHFRPAGMMHTLVAVAAAQAAIGAAAVLAGWGAEGPNWPRDVIGANGMFAALWLASATLFGRAARI
ncbi:hypothetical protein [Stigmatella hybrida]|uniref:hypothetical protein n=1 Tax=Stigmatella hybrida TaxID=394097 RepID=UPI001CDB4343|nr:hypothetical protein [Stigmatella hybrida]